MYSGFISTVLAVGHNGDRSCTTETNGAEEGVVIVVFLSLSYT